MLNSFPSFVKRSLTLGNVLPICFFSISSKTFSDLKNIMPKRKLSKEETLELRDKYIGKSCMLFYHNDPLKIVKSNGQYMYDETGKEYLDCINNVSHVGHCHPTVVEAASKQMSILNTNSRYLHDNLSLLAEKLTSLFPDPLSVCYFVNSGSEANDLAIRLAKVHTKSDNVIVLDHAYHGITYIAQSLSPYKFNDKTCYTPKPDWVHVAPNPDEYRGIFNKDNHPSEDLGELYSNEIFSIAKSVDKNFAGFIHESLQSCAGQVMMPKNYLKKSYEIVRKYGGVCIADEVQVGFGRVGEPYWWAFQLYDVVPDIVTVGKPMGNGHPVSAVITTKKIAESFTERECPFFSTFAGNPVSCSIALAVIDVIEKENLRQHAKTIGTYLLNEFKKLKKIYKIIGDVRGFGMFIGIELVTNRETKEPASFIAKNIVNNLRQRQIIISHDGPFENILKFKPPMCFNLDNAIKLVKELNVVLKEEEIKFFD